MGPPISPAIRPSVGAAEVELIAMVCLGCHPEGLEDPHVDRSQGVLLTTSSAPRAQRVRATGLGVSMAAGVRPW